MSSTGAGYDLSPTTFSPDGRIFQVEYASKAVENSSTALGVRCADGVVMAVEKLLMSKLLVPGSNRRLQTIDKCAGIAITGLVADGRQLVNRARSECSGWLDAYNYHMPPDVLCNHLSEYVHYFTLHGSLRPFGAACILASYDEVGARAQRCSPRHRPTHVFCVRARPDAGAEDPPAAHDRAVGSLLRACFCAVGLQCAVNPQRARMLSSHAEI